MPQNTYPDWPWPASALSAQDMHLLYLARELSRKRQPITRLLAQAVRHTYGHLARDTHTNSDTHTIHPNKEAA